MKLSIVSRNQNQIVDEGFGSQDSEQFFNDDEEDKEIEDFEKSIEKFEEEFKENQSALKSLHKKVTSKKPAKKVSDFFKPKSTAEKKTQNKKNILIENQPVSDQNDSNTIETSRKRSNSFSK